MLTVAVRPEQPRDRAAVRALHECAFGDRAEADLVEALHGAQATVVALVAEEEGEIVGHILFSSVQLDGASEVAAPRRLVGLAPMAVFPRFQRRGIGTRLVWVGLDRCRAASIDAVVVVGHSGYYPRFGFVPAHEFGLRCEFEVPPEVFLARELTPDALAAVTGLVRYHPVFSGA